MEQQQTDRAEGGAVIPAVLPVCISDKAMLVAEELRLPSPQPQKRSKKCKNSGSTTWMMAAIALPTIGLLLLLTLLLVAEPLDTDRRLGVTDAAFWKGRWRKSHIPRRNIFILDINSDSFPSEKKIAVLETCLTTNKYHEIYQITINQYIDQPRNISAFNKLKKKYSNFHFLFQNAPSFFRGSIFEDAVNDPSSYLLFKAQLLMLWRYAGIVLAPNWIALKPLDKMFSKSDKTFNIGTNCGQIGFLSVSNPCNSKLFDIMSEVKKSNCSQSAQLDVIDRVMLKYKSGFKRFDSPQVCNNNTINNECILMRETAPTETLDPAPFIEFKNISDCAENFNRSTLKTDRETGKYNFMPRMIRRFLIFS